MKTILQACALLAIVHSATALAADVDEQTRRCRIEKDALKNPGHREGPECLKLRAMLDMPEPPRVYNNAPTYSEQQGPRRVFDPQSNRWCWIYPNGAPMQCD
ncbi:MAG: hypothetical protein ACREVL_01135 [Solimonas sp.]